MLTHLFKLIWNKKKQNFLIMLELFFSFLIMFAVFTLLTSYYKSYRTPLGFDYSDVWSITRTASPMPAGRIVSPDSLAMADKMVKQQIRYMPEIQGVTYSGANIPYSDNRAAIDVSYEKVKEKCNIYTVDDNYADVLGIKIQRGRWFNKTDDAANYTPIVINERLKEKLFGNKEAVNKQVVINKDGYKVIGVAANMKSNGDYAEAESGFFSRGESSLYGNNSTIQVKLKPGTDVLFESRLYKSLVSLTQGASIEIQHLEKRRIKKNRETLLTLIIIITIVIFFIINVALGLFGVLWHNISKRKGEIGLRRAIGASENSIARHMVGEALVLASLSLLAGSFFAIQFPLLNIFDISATIYLTALLLSAIFIYLLVILCALYPARQAAAIFPALALHDQ